MADSQLKFCLYCLVPALVQPASLGHAQSWLLLLLLLRLLLLRLLVLLPLLLPLLMLLLVVLVLVLLPVLPFPRPSSP
jgi:hypothetical protein